MDLRLVHLDAFADQVFHGNPAAVMPLPNWLPDEILQRIAAENNLPETAFYVAALPAGVTPPDRSDAAYHLRWFTPVIEVDLCGHGTLATAGQLFDDVHPQATRLSFWTRSGWLHVRRGNRPAEVVMDFPAEVPRQLSPDDPIRSAAAGALGIHPELALRGTDVIFVARDEAAVLAVAPDFAALRDLPVRGVMVTAPSCQDGIDFVSRWFGAQAGIPEDPVTGSAHSQLTPYWAARLGRTELTARQLSARGGTVSCQLDGDRVRLGGAYRRYLDGMVTIP